jgi:AraC-like DNA-binding protein
MDRKISRLRFGAADRILDQLRGDRKIRALLKGFENAVGVRLVLVGMGEEDVKRNVLEHEFCGSFMNSSDKAADHCARAHTQTRGNARKWTKCEAGLLHSSVPIFVHGEPVGSLFAFGIVRENSRASFHQKFDCNGDQEALLRLFAKLPRHSEARISGVIPLMDAVVDSIENHAHNSIPHREIVLPALLYRATKYAGKHYAKDSLTPSLVGRKLGITPQRLAQLFRKHLHTTFMWWISCYRVSKAMKRLRSTKRERIVEISLKCGFATVSTFNRYFRKINGISPGEFRSGIEPHKSSPGRRK